MEEFWQWIASSSGTVLLAILAGAGGSALLELLWKPRRDRRRAATLLLAEVALNTELLLLHAHARNSAPRQIPADLRMSTMAWSATAPLVSELPAKLVRKLVILYNRYDSLNRQIELFSDAVRERTTTSGSAKINAELMVVATLNAFNTGVDAAIDQGKELLRELVDVAGWKENSAERAQVVDYAQVAAKHMRMRQDQLNKLKGDAPDGTST